MPETALSGVPNDPAGNLHMNLWSRAAVVLLVGVGSSVAPFTAGAQEAEGWYLGGSFGRSTNHYDTSAYEHYLESLAGSNESLKFTSSSVQRRANSWWADAGYMRWSHVGIELDFIHVGELAYHGYATLKTTGKPDKALEAVTNVSSRGPALTLRARLPLADGLDLNLRLGDYYGRTATTRGYALGSTYSPTTKTSTVSSLLLGAGLAYTLDYHFALHADYLRINQTGDSSTGRFNADMITAGLSYTF
jgi:OmpA-like transmembrane domain